MPHCRARWPLAAALGFAAAGWCAAQQPVAGTVRYTGPEFRVRTIQLGADPKCEEVAAAARVPAQDRLVAGDGGVANAFVYLETVPAGTPAAPSEVAVLTQRGCMYRPRVLGVLTNQKLSIVNDDPTLHNVRFLATANRPFNIGQPAATPPREKTFTIAEKAVKFKCDVHPWMESYLFVMEHPFWAVSGTDGRWSIPRVPAGKHTLVVWHESFGEQKIAVQVGGAPVAGADVSYAGASPKP